MSTTNEQALLIWNNIIKYGMIIVLCPPEEYCMWSGATQISFSVEKESELILILELIMLIYCSHLKWAMTSFVKRDPQVTYLARMDSDADSMQT